MLIAGTNGKGSVAALVDASLRAAHYRVVRSTSPHLVNPCERITIDGNPIPDEELAEYLVEIESQAQGLVPPTYFEALVAATFLAARSHRADALVLEVGMGGRLDATNACSPLVSVVTRIGLDHTRELGPFVGGIAGEKAGILRPNRPGVVAPQRPAAWAVLFESARKVGAKFVSVEDVARIVHSRFLGLDGHELECQTTRDRYAFRLPLAGEHQIDNAQTALVACEEFAALGFAALNRSAIENGFSRVVWPGRLESFRIPGQEGMVLLDAAHNRDGCLALAGFLKQLGTPYALLFGCLADKPVRALLEPLLAGARRLVATSPESPRALPASEVAALAESLSSVPRTLEPDPRKALMHLLHGPEPLKVVAGSLYLVGPIRTLVGELVERAAR